MTATGSSPPHVTLFNAPGPVRSFTWCLSPCLLLTLPLVSPLRLPNLLASTPAIDAVRVRAPLVYQQGRGPNKLQGCCFCLLRVLARQLGHRHQPVRATHHPAGRDQRPPFLARAHRLDRAVTLMDCDSAIFPVCEQPVNQRGALGGVTAWTGEGEW
ncbi:hypothetical protein LI328DRAFT_129428 [Trichoderma asperelloides]|nr:hypothetical protein LI328DRAFT_129428 [Trichoderma asperelloides]